MHTKKLCSINVPPFISLAFIEIAKQKLSNKERQVLNILGNRENNKNATQTVKEIITRIRCAESTAWAILRSLRSLELIEYDAESKRIVISESGKVLIEGGVR